MSTRSTALEEFWVQFKQMILQGARETAASTYGMQEWYEKYPNAQFRSPEQIAAEALEKVREEMGDQLNLFLSYPSRAAEIFFPLYGKHFAGIWEKEIEDSEEVKMGIDAARKQQAALLQQLYAHIQVLEEALKGQDFDRAEQIVRGQLALDEHDIEMINYLYNIGCLGGKADLIIEARALAEKSERGNAEVDNSTLLTVFLQKSVIAGYHVLQKDLTGIAYMASHVDEFSLQKANELGAMITHQAAIRIQEQFISIAEWTPQSFLEMCRATIQEKTESYNRLLVGMILSPVFQKCS